MNYVPFCLFIILSAINIKSRDIGMNKISGLTKLTLAPLALINVLVNTSLDVEVQTILIIAYSFYLIGDAFLLSDKTTLFGIGLVSFLLGHICFTIIFILHRVSLFYVPFAIIALIYPFYKMFIITRAGGKLKIPMRLYSVMLIIFIVTSTMMNNPLFAIATSFFTLSDSFIAKNACLKEKKYGEFKIMGTYTIALILLSCGMILVHFT
jgi:uncharacterized membrane protein YhhN